MHEILSSHADFAALWGDRALFEISTREARLRIGDDVKVIEVLPRDQFRTGRYVHARVSHLTIADGLPDKVILGLIKIHQGDAVLERGRR